MKKKCLRHNWDYTNELYHPELGEVRFWMCSKCGLIKFAETYIKLGDI